MKINVTYWMDQKPLLFISIPSFFTKMHIILVVCSYFNPCNCYNVLFAYLCISSMRRFVSSICEILAENIILNLVWFFMRNALLLLYKQWKPGQWTH